MTTKEAVTISRHWHNPQIHAAVNLKGIFLTMSLDDFQEALITEIGNPAMLLTKAQLRTKIAAAFVHIVDGIKAESAKVI